MKATKDIPILSVLTFSYYRKEALFLIQKGPTSLDEIKDYFDVKSPEILPHLKKMVEHDLIFKREGNYELTYLGEIVAVNYKPFLDTLAAIETNKNFWTRHDLSAIPTDLRTRIGDLVDCKVSMVEDYNICESHPEFVYNVEHSSIVEGAACIFRKSWMKLILDLASQNVPIRLIVTEDIYNKIRREYTYDLETLLKNEKAHMYICDKLSACFTITDKYFSLSLNNLNGLHDTKYDLMGYGPKPIIWGKALFKYYLENSTEVKNIKPLNEVVIQEPYLQSFSVQQ
ncbi:MAG: winged helix-turn-helix domain-containing protein [Methanosarcina sp.]|nr:winged helix-turn-helix domain-containing protein [Methanosarcina sp.]